MISSPNNSRNSVEFGASASRVPAGQLAGRPRSGGWTLVELVIVLVVIGVLSSVTFVALSEAMRIYARATPSARLAYQSQLTSVHLRRDLRGLPDSSSIEVFQPQLIRFLGEDGGSIEYRLVGSDLLRNSRLLAEGVSGLRFQYTTAQGTPAANPEDVALVDAALLLAEGSIERRLHVAVHPRRFQP